MASAHEGQPDPVSYKTPVVLVVVKYGINLVTDRGKNKNNKVSKLL